MRWSVIINGTIGGFGVLSIMLGKYLHNAWYIFLGVGLILGAYDMTQKIIIKKIRAKKALEKN